VLLHKMSPRYPSTEHAGRHRRHPLPKDHRPGLRTKERPLYYDGREALLLHPGDGLGRPVGAAFEAIPGQVPEALAQLSKKIHRR